MAEVGFFCLWGLPTTQDPRPREGNYGTVLALGFAAKDHGHHSLYLFARGHPQQRHRYLYLTERDELR